MRDVAGVPVALVGEWGDSWLAALPAHAGPPAARLVVGDGVPPAPSRACDLAVGGLQAWWRADGSVVLAGSGVRAHVRDTEAVVAGADPLTVNRVVQLALMHLLAPHGRFLLHAAGVTPGAGAWLVLGESGSGKSTVAAVAAAHGWGLLGDDLVAVRRGSAATVEVLGIPRPVAVPPELGLAGEALPGDSRRRVRLALDLVEGWQPVAGVLVVAHGDATGGLEPRSGDAVLPVLLGSSFLVGERERLARYFPLAAALARLPAFTLWLPRDPAVRQARVGELLGAIGRPVAGSR